MKGLTPRRLSTLWFASALAMMSSASFAAGWTGWSTPSRADIVRNEGLMVYGSFGNPSGCSVSDQFFVAIDHPQYNQIYATVMMAMATGRLLMAYSVSCTPVSWYAGPSTTFNTVSADSVVNVQ